MYHLVTYNLLHYYVLQLENINFFYRSYSITITMTFIEQVVNFETIGYCINLRIKIMLLTHALSLNIFVSYTFSLIL